MLDALVRQWKRYAPLPIALQRFSRWFGVPEPKPAELAKSQPMDQAAFDRLRQFIPVKPSTHIVQPMSPEDFRKLHQGGAANG